MLAGKPELMRTIRIYHPEALTAGSEYSLAESAANHVARVLRMGVGDPVVLFCGDNREYSAEIIAVGKRDVRVQINRSETVDRESPLALHLAQAISRGEKMDFTLQKAVELGVASIQPLFTERCGVKLADERLDKRLDHWRGVVVAACEQSGRNRVPEVFPPLSLAQWLAEERPGLRLTLAPGAGTRLNDLPVPVGPVHLLVGPEGGLSDAEIAETASSGFTGISLGPRILRTETAGLAVIAALQARFGDF